MMLDRLAVGCKLVWFLVAIASCPSGSTCSLLRCVLAVLALLSQLTLGSITPEARATAADALALDSVSVLCGPGTGHLSDHPVSPARHTHPVSLGQPALELPAVLRLDASILPAAPPAPRRSRAVLPAPRGPPLPLDRPVQARAPPGPV